MPLLTHVALVNFEQLKHKRAADGWRCGVFVTSDL